MEHIRDSTKRGLLQTLFTSSNLREEMLDHRSAQLVESMSVESLQNRIEDLERCNTDHWRNPKAVLYQRLKSKPLTVSCLPLSITTCLTRHNLKKHIDSQLVYRMRHVLKKVREGHMQQWLETMATRINHPDQHIRDPSKYLMAELTKLEEEVPREEEQNVITEGNSAPPIPFLLQPPSVEIQYPFVLSLWKEEHVRHFLRRWCPILEPTCDMDGETLRMSLTHVLEQLNKVSLISVTV